MNMQIFDEKEAIEREYAMILFREFLQRVFKVYNQGVLWYEFITHARLMREKGDAHESLATAVFNAGWKIIAYALYQSRAPVDINEDLMSVLTDFFADPDNPQTSYSQIAIDAIWEDQSSLESFRHLKQSLDSADGQDCQFSASLPEEELEKIAREDLLRSLVKLAMLPSLRFPESTLLRDRQRWVFAEDLKRLVERYLPDSGIQTTVEELKNLIVEIMPKFRNKPNLLSLINDYEAELTGEIYELTDVVEEPVHEPVTEVSVSVVVIDGITHLAGIGNQLIQFSAKGILAALAKLKYAPGAEDDFSDEVKAMLYKIMEVLRGSEDKKFNAAFSLLGAFREFLYEIKIKLSKVYKLEPEKLTNAQRQQRIILDAIGPIEAEISEIMPISWNPPKKCSDGIRIQG